MKTIQINLPTVLEFEDYHDGPYFESEARKIIPGLKVKEIYSNYDIIDDTIDCFFMAYVGTLKEERNRSFLNCLKRKFKEVKKQQEEVNRQELE